MSSAQAAAITARLDRLPASASVWRLVVLLSLGGLFEIYDLFLTPYVMPGLIRSQIFQKGQNGLFGLPDQASFLSCTFAGLFLGTIVFASVADKFGRRVIFTYALLWYALATGIMAAQDSRGGILLWRFIAGVGIGVELVTIDTYISELVPKSIRGRAFAINQSIQFVAVPLATFLSWQLVPIDPLGIAGWRWVVAVPVLGALFVWWIRREVPESPRCSPSTAGQMKPTASRPRSRRGFRPRPRPRCRRRSLAWSRAAAPDIPRSGSLLIGGAPSCFPSSTSFRSSASMASAAGCSNC